MQQDFREMVMTGATGGLGSDVTQGHFTECGVVVLSIILSAQETLVLLGSDYRGFGLQ